MQTIPAGTDKPTVCTKAVLEQSVSLHPLMHHKDNSVLQEEVMYIAISNKGQTGWSGVHLTAR